MTNTEWKTELAKVPVDDRVNVEERAAIHQFDGGLEKDEAERRAIKEYWRSKGEFGL